MSEFSGSRFRRQRLFSAFDELDCLICYCIRFLLVFLRRLRGSRLEVVFALFLFLFDEEFFLFDLSDVFQSPYELFKVEDVAVSLWVKAQLLIEGVILLQYFPNVGNFDFQVKVFDCDRVHPK